MRTTVIISLLALIIFNFLFVAKPIDPLAQATDGKTQVQFNNATPLVIDNIVDSQRTFKALAAKQKEGVVQNELVPLQLFIIEPPKIEAEKPKQLVATPAKATVDPKPIPIPLLRLKPMAEVRTLEASRAIGKPNKEEAKARVATDEMLSIKEKDLLARLVTAEANGEPFQGLVAVAAVVLNRMHSEEWPNTVASVILQPRQFQPVSNGTIEKKPTAEAIHAVQEALNGNDPTNGALFFYNPAIARSNPDPSAKKTVVIGNHTFLK